MRSDDRALRRIPIGVRHLAMPAILMAGLAVGGQTAMAQTPGADDSIGVAVFENTQGEEIGIAALLETPHGVLIQAAFDGLNA